MDVAKKTKKNGKDCVSCRDNLILLQELQAQSVVRKRDIVSIFLYHCNRCCSKKVEEVDFTGVLGLQSHQISRYRFT